jgi:hypothetical protein
LLRILKNDYDFFIFEAAKMIMMTFAMVLVVHEINGDKRCNLVLCFRMLIIQIFHACFVFSLAEIAYVEICMKCNIYQYHA